MNALFLKDLAEKTHRGLRGRVEKGNVRMPLQVDVGAGDAVVPAPEVLDYPSLLDLPAHDFAPTGPRPRLPRRRKRWYASLSQTAE
jgi:hypothetical protein